MDNFKFKFLSRGQLESLNLDRIFLIFAIIARMLCGNHLNISGSIGTENWLKRLSQANNEEKVFHFIIQ